MRIVVRIAVESYVITSDPVLCPSFPVCVVEELKFIFVYIVHWLL